MWQTSLISQGTSEIRQQKSKRRLRGKKYQQTNSEVSRVDWTSITMQVQLLSTAANIIMTSRTAGKNLLRQRSTFCLSCVVGFPSSFDNVGQRNTAVNLSASCTEHTECLPLTQTLTVLHTIHVTYVRDQPATKNIHHRMSATHKPSQCFTPYMSHIHQ